MKQLWLLLCFLIPNYVQSVPKKNYARTYQTIAKQIKKIIDTNPHLHIGCEIYSLKNRHIVYAHHERHLFAPASNITLFLAILALGVLGQDYRFETLLVTDGTVDKNVIDGNLYIKGSGDPSLKSADIERLFKSLSHDGITTITGDLCIDQEDFDHECFAPGSLLDNIGAPWNSPVSSLMIDRKPCGLCMMPTIPFMENDSLHDMFFDGGNFFESVLQKYGIELRGKVSCLRSPEKYSTINTHYSESISLLVSHMLKESDNLYADCLFKKIGTHCYGFPGTWAKGVDAMMDFLPSLRDKTMGDLIINDGSGRSRYNLISPHHIISLLTWAYEQPYFFLFHDSLACAGIDGTLKNRMENLALHVKAKTGSLAGISSLSGYVETEQDMFAFSILINGYVSESIYNPPCKTEIEDAICQILATA